ncbi:MAG TPA: homoserine O-acetyltransferase [Flavisolibacter sp.]|nr:homoserine O-acetyltransferase [Flavisolibacter sp.]
MNTQLFTQTSGQKEHLDSAQVFRANTTLTLESGGVLKNISIAYHSWGTLNEKGDNVIWICHALTANSNAKDWWPNLIGEGLAFDTSRYFVVCANILGSCYGTTGPTDTDPDTGKPYLHSFPFITIRDMVKAHLLLRQHLGIRSIHLLAGGSMGGYQALEWAVMEPDFIKHVFMITTSAKESAWGIAIHTAQRMAIETDASWKEGGLTDGRNGLKVARAIGMLTYRSYESFVKAQNDTNNEKVDGFMASSYIQYQGEKLAARFTAYSYWVLSKALDSHNLARGKGSTTAVLGTIRAKTLVIGITSDLLCPLQELRFLAENIPGASFAAIDSFYGHDGFLVETAAITDHLSRWLSS